MHWIVLPVDGQPCSARPQSMIPFRTADPPAEGGLPVGSETPGQGTSALKSLILRLLFEYGNGDFKDLHLVQF